MASELPDRLLHDLVAVDELHLVRLGVRHRRRPVPPADVRADRRASSSSRPGVPSAFDDLDFTIGRRRLRDHAHRRSWRSGCARRWEDPRRSTRRAAVRGGHRRSSSSLWVVRLAIGPPWGFVALLVLGVLELGDPGLGRAVRTPDAVASGAHRRAVRPVHDHRARRVRPGHDDRRPGVAGRRRRRRARWSRSRSAAWCSSSGCGGPTSSTRAASMSALSLRAAIAWGYGHYVVFASVAALGAGLQVATDSILGDVGLGASGGGARRWGSRWSCTWWPSGSCTAGRRAVGSLVPLGDRLRRDPRRGPDRGHRRECPAAVAAMSVVVAALVAFNVVAMRRAAAAG